MTWAQFLERFRHVGADLDTYVAGLPPWVNVWRGWMFLLFTMVLVFVFRKTEARWLALVMVVSLFAYNVISAISGVGRFPSIAFVALWTPLFLHFVRRVPLMKAESRFDRLYLRWARAIVLTLGTSVAFDAYNVAYSVVRGAP